MSTPSTPPSRSLDPSLPEALLGHIGYLAVRFGQRAQRQFERAMAELDLRPQDYDFLSVIAESGPLSQREAATTLGVDPTRIVALADHLQERHLVARTIDPADRRRNLVTLTPGGQDLVRRAADVAAGVEAELVRELAPAERDALRSLLRRTVEPQSPPA